MEGVRTVRYRFFRLIRTLDINSSYGIRWGRVFTAEKVLVDTIVPMKFCGFPALLLQILLPISLLISLSFR
jgi:hypothetical protein